MNTLNVEVEFSEADSERIDRVDLGGMQYSTAVIHLALIGLAAVEAVQTLGVGG